MAFDVKNFGRVSSHLNSNLPSRWAYTTEDAADDVDDAGYFNDVIDFLKVGDIIEAKVNTGVSTDNKVYVVDSNDGTNVDTLDDTDPTGFGASDSD